MCTCCYDHRLHQKTTLLFSLLETAREAKEEAETHNDGVRKDEHEVENRLELRLKTLRGNHHYS